MGKGMVNGLIGAVFAGVVGAAVWAAIVYYTNMEIGYVAWGIGALVGFAMAFGAGSSAGSQTGVLAAVVAAVSVAGGKFALAYLFADPSRRMEVFLGMFDAFDLLFFGLAILTAFRLGKGARATSA